MEFKTQKQRAVVGAIVTAILGTLTATIGVSVESAGAQILCTLLTLVFFITAGICGGFALVEWIDEAEE